MKKVYQLISAVICITMLAALGAGCQGGNSESQADSAAPSDSAPVAESGSEAAPDAGETPADSAAALNIGVVQFGTHPSLDNCFQGVEEGMAASGLSYGDLDRQDGNFDSATCDTIAKNMVAKNYDLIFAIATPAAVSAYSAAQSSDIPVVFCAVSDPQEAGLVDDAQAPGGNCTGTSDQLDLSAQIAMITTLQPEVKKIGVLYTTSEVNSISHLRQLKAVCEPLGLEVVEQGVQGAADVPQAAAALAAKVDCINNFTDNNVVSNLQEVLAKAGEAGIPVYGSEIEQVKNGCLASASIDYVALGRETANIAKQILEGADPGTIPVSYIAESTPVINTDVAATLNITIPEAYAGAETVTTGQE